MPSNPARAEWGIKMKTIIVSKEQLIEVIAGSSKNFGDPFISIAVDNEGVAYSSENINFDDHIIMSLSGLENYMDENQIYPGNEGYDSESVAKYIVENEDFLKTDMEYDDEENIEIKIVGVDDITKATRK